MSIIDSLRRLFSTARESSTPDAPGRSKNGPTEAPPPTSEHPSLSALPRVMSRTNAYTPTLRFVVCASTTGGGRRHLGFVEGRGRDYLYAHCFDAHHGDLEEMRDQHIDTIDCSKCRSRIALLRDPNHPTMRQAEDERRSYAGSIACAQKAKSHVRHVVVIPEGDSEDSPSLRSICGTSGPLSIFRTTYGTKITFSCGRCATNIGTVPRHLRASLVRSAGEPT